MLHAYYHLSQDSIFPVLTKAKRHTGRPQLHYKDVCKRNLKALGTDINGWETLASERSAWRQEVQQSLPEFEETLTEQAETKRQTRDRPEIPTTSRKGLSWYFEPHKICSRTTN